MADTLQEAQDWLRERLDEGETCPCCKQFAKVYRRKLTSVPARTMIAMWREARFEFVHIPTLLQKHLPTIAHQGGYATLGAYWRLISEEREVRRPDGGRAGYWRLTSTGAEFVHELRTVPRYARIYDGRRLGFAGEPISIRDALGTNFDYDELMGA